MERGEITQPYPPYPYRCRASELMNHTRVAAPVGAARLASSRSSVFAWVVCFAFDIASAASAADVRTVALSGQPAPGTPSGVSFSGFDGPSLNAVGQTAFSAD